MKYIFKSHNADLVNHLFQILLVTYLILLLVEQVFSGSISVYLNLNWLLLVVIIAGILDVFSEHHIIMNKKPTKKDYLFIYALGILGFLIIKYKTFQLGWLSWVISIVAGILIILLSILVLDDEEENKPKK